MAEEKKGVTQIAETISLDYISKHGVQALADRPNAKTKYGESGLSAADLKKHFDNLATALAERINDIIEKLSSSGAAGCIGVNLGEDNGGDSADPDSTVSLQELIDSFASGVFAASVLKLKYLGANSTPATLQDVIETLNGNISSNNEKIGENKNNLNALDDRKLDKAEKAGYAPASYDSAAYTVTHNGGQELMRISQSEPNSIVKRQGNGGIFVADADMSSDYHAVNKKYVDDGLGYIRLNCVNRLDFSMDNEFVLAIKLFSLSNREIATYTVDLPLETMVIDATCSGSTLTLKLQNEKTVDVDVSAIVSGLVPNDFTVNKNSLYDADSKNIELGASDVGAYTKEEVNNTFLKSSEFSSELNTELVALAEEKKKNDPDNKYIHLYGWNATNKELVTQVIRVAATPNSLAHRDEKGRLSGAAPESDKHLTNKKYVDDKDVALDGRLTKAEKSCKTLDDRLVDAEEKLDTLAASGGGQPTVLLTEVEDTFTERETAGGLNVADGTVSEVKKITGATVAVYTLLNGGDIYADQNEIFITAEAAAAAGYPTPDSDGLTGYFSGDFSFIVYGEEDCYSIPEGFYFNVQNASFGDFSDGDVICRVGDAWQLVTSELKHAFFQGIECTSADGKKQSELSLAEPVELGRWDTLDVESGKIERYTRAMGVMDLPLAYSAVDDGSYKCFCFMYGADKVPLHANESAFDIVSTYYEARSLSANDKSICVQSGAGGRPLFQIRDDSCLVFADPDGYEFDADASKQKFIDHLTDIGLVLEYRTAEVQSTEAVDCPTGYVAYNGGTERVVQGDVDNSAHGAKCTVTQTYYVSYGGDT